MTVNSNRDGAHGPSTATPPVLNMPAIQLSDPLSLPRSESQGSSISPDAGRRYNVQNLPWRITSDLTAAACASLLVAPLIAMIDKGIIENASGRRPLRASLLSSLHTLFTRPHTFIMSIPFRLITTVYFGTYVTANSIDTISSTLSPSPASTTTHGPAKFLATTSANMSLGLYKDSRFARMFGPPGGSGVVRTIPKVSYALFALRDSLTICASFNLPHLVAPMLPLSKEIEKSVSRASVAQFLAPAGMQLLSTPLHLWGLDLYNRPGRGPGEKITWPQRLSRVRRDWLGSSFARMGRIIPAFGVGGVVNGGVRARMLTGLEE